MIAITFALPDESSDLIRRMTRVCHAPQTKAGPVCHGLLNGELAVVFHTGVGRAAARAETPRLLREFQPYLVISSGYAGALTDALSLGQMAADFRRAPHLAASTELQHFTPGTIVTLDRVVESPQEKAELFQSSGAIAVEMETDEIAAVCAEKHTPLVTLRAISDRASDLVPVPMQHWFNLQDQRPNVSGLLAYLATHPARIAPFARFVAGLSGPRRAIAKCLPAVIPALREAISIQSGRSISTGYAR